MQPQKVSESGQSSMEPHLGVCLVVGGSGFLGHHIVKFLLEDPSCTSIAVMSRSPFKNRFNGVTYHIGDITNLEHVRHILGQVKPNVIFNTASPHAYVDYEHAIDNFTVNVDGTRHLLDVAAEVGTVRAFVYTSSGPIIAGKGSGYNRADETYPTLEVTRKGDSYHVAKAIADKFTLDANGKNGILTACIRPTALYGEGDGQMVGPVIKVLEDGQTNFWMGYNDIEMDVVYVGHVAKAEVLAARGLLLRHLDLNAPRIDGQAFNITDDEPCKPWTFFRKYWTLAGDNTPLSSVWMFPPWLVMVITYIAEWFVWVMSWGKDRPCNLKVERMEFILLTRTYNINKARNLLGFKPWKDQPYTNQEDAVKGSLDWYLSPEVHGPIKVKGASPWPESPFRLINNTGANTKFGLQHDHYCVKNARIMATTHNAIFRALNAIYHQALQITPGSQDASDFLSYCSAVFNFMHHHSITEEVHFFSEIESVSGIPGLMDINFAQHAEIDGLMDKLRNYAETTRKEKYDGAKLLIMIYELREPYETHMHDEIGTILDLHDKIDSASLKRIDKHFRDEAEKNSDMFKAAPLFLGCQDKNFCIDDEKSTFPELSFIIPHVVNFALAPRHANLWRFNPSTIYGRPRRPLSAPENVDTKPKAPVLGNLQKYSKLYLMVASLLSALAAFLTTILLI